MAGEEIGAAGGHHGTEDEDNNGAKRQCRKPLMQALSEGRTNMQALLVRYFVRGLVHHAALIQDWSRDGHGRALYIPENTLFDLAVRGLADGGFPDIAREVTDDDTALGKAAKKQIRALIYELNDANVPGSNSRSQGLVGYRIAADARQKIEAALRDLKGLDGSVLLDPRLPRSAYQAGWTQQLHAAREEELQQLLAAREAELRQTLAAHEEELGQAEATKAELQQMIAARDEEVRQAEARNAQLRQQATAARSGLEALGAAPGQMLPRNAHVLDAMLDKLEAARRRVVSARAAVPVITCPICEEEDKPQGAWDCESGHMACRACLQGWLDQQGGPGRASCHMCSQPVTSFRNVTIS